MDFFYETQPVPGPLSRRLHFLPKWFHRGSTLTNHVVELGLVWLLLVPPTTPGLAQVGLWAGLVQLAFQAMLIAAGNLSFINVLTMLPALWCLNDGVVLGGLQKLPFSAAFVGGTGCEGAPAAAAAAAATAAAEKAAAAVMASASTTGSAALFFSATAMARFISTCFADWPNGLFAAARVHGVSVLAAVLVAWRSVPVVRNLASRKQAMNQCYDPWRLVNSYGAFGDVHEHRDEIVVSGADSVDPGVRWREYSFAVKPGDVRRPAPFIVPYHHRLDWCLWVAAFCRPSSTKDPAGPDWLPRLLLRLLQNDPQVAALLAGSDAGESFGNPFKTGPPPRYIKVERFRYAFAKPGSPESIRGELWKRSRIGWYYSQQPIVCLTDLAHLDDW
jgi:hypothetical protein